MCSSDLLYAAKADALRYGQRGLLGAAHMQRRQQRVADAMKTYAKAEAVDPRTSRAQEARPGVARLLPAGKQVAKAIEKVQAALESAPTTEADAPPGGEGPCRFPHGISRHERRAQGTGVTWAGRCTGVWPWPAGMGLAERCLHRTCRKVRKAAPRRVFGKWLEARAGLIGRSIQLRFETT